MFICEYENDPIRRAKVNSAGERKGNQRAKFWKRWEMMRREQSGGIGHSDRKDTIKYNRKIEEEEEGRER